MRAPYICVAGVDQQRRHVRPVVAGGRLDASMLADRGGMFGLGRIVELADPIPRPSTPELEDVAFSPARSRLVGRCSARNFWDVLEEVALTSLDAIFGPDLVRDGNTASLPVGAGEASLGVLRPSHRPTLELAFDRPRLSFSDSHMGRLSVPVTDLRFFDPMTGALDQRRLELAHDRLRRRSPLLCVGVGQPWGREGDEPRHWLQVNNLNLDDNPFWPE